MTKREDVIKELEAMQKHMLSIAGASGGISHITAQHYFGAITDALELLKEQEPRVLTLEEVLSQAWDYCYIEAQVRPHSETLEMLCGTHRLYCTTSIVLERQTRGDKEYGKTWRCWTARPTVEESKAVKWDG